MPSENPPVIYTIDADDRIIEVNDGWVVFARNNAGDELAPARVAGRKLWDFVTDATTVSLYRAMCQRLRLGGPPIRFQFRCDAPSIRRLLSMEMASPDRVTIQFTVRPVSEQARTPVPVVAQTSAVAAGPLISMCSWCKRVRIPDGTWVEIEQALDTFGLFQEFSDLPALTHGICESCERALARDLEDKTVILGPFQAT